MRDSDIAMDPVYIKVAEEQDNITQIVQTATGSPGTHMKPTGYDEEPTPQNTTNKNFWGNLFRLIT